MSARAFNLFTSLKQQGFCETWGRARFRPSGQISTAYGSPDRTTFAHVHPMNSSYARKSLIQRSALKRSGAVDRKSTARIRWKIRVIWVLGRVTRLLGGFFGALLSFGATRAVDLRSTVLESLFSLAARGELPSLRQESSPAAGVARPTATARSTDRAIDRPPARPPATARPTATARSTAVRGLMLLN